MGKFEKMLEIKNDVEELASFMNYIPVVIESRIEYSQRVFSLSEKTQRAFAHIDGALPVIRKFMNEITPVLVAKFDSLQAQFDELDKS